MAVRATASKPFTDTSLPLDVLTELVRHPDQYDQMIRGIAEEREKSDKAWKRARAAEASAAKSGAKADEKMRELQKLREDLAAAEEEFNKRMEREREAVRAELEKAAELRGKAEAVSSENGTKASELDRQIQGYNQLVREAERKQDELDRKSREADERLAAIEERRENIEAQLRELQSRLEGFQFS